MRALILLTLLLPAAFAEDVDDVQFHGGGWFQFGRVEHSSDTLANGEEFKDYNNFNKNWIQSTGGQITAVQKISDNWEGGLGLGAILVSNSRGSVEGAHTWTTWWNPFVTEARLTFTQPLGPKNKLQLTVGSFPYVYNPDIKNLGLYLTRGQVYPGTLFSGFETKHTQPTAATQVGGMARIQIGNFQNDLLLNSETETKPFFDLSLMDIVSYQATPWLQIGAGVNFYRLIAQNPKVTSPGTSCAFDKEWSGSNLPDASDRCYVLDTVYSHVGHIDTSLVDPTAANTPGGVLQINPVLDSIKFDTILGSMAGTKLMARFRFDPKILLGLKGVGSWTWGKNDLVLYGEAAVLGLQDYPRYYPDIWQRMPVTLGFNLPAFGLLDRLALEVEYYGSRNFPDYEKAETSASWVPRQISGDGIDSSRTITYNGYTYNKVRTSSILDYTRNDWKWSLYASRVLMGHLRIAGQVANDHLLIPGPPSAPDPDWEEALTTPKDWYWMLKLAYFF